MRRSLVGFAVLAGAATGLVACGQPQVSSSPTTPPTSPATSATGPIPSGKAVAPSGQAPPSVAAGLGDTIELTGTDAGERIAVTLVQVVDPAEPATEFDRPSQGSRLVGAQLRLSNTGTSTYQDAPANSATLVDAFGQAFPSTIGDISAGPSFPGGVTVAPGDSGLGFVVFALPSPSAPSKLQFALDSGLATDVGQWRISGQPAGPSRVPETPRTPSSPETTPPPAPSPSPSTADPAQVVRDYYAAINAGDYATAWALGGQNLGGSYQDFVSGFSDTSYDTVTIVSSSGEAVQIELDAEQTDGSHRYFAGTYTVRDGVIVAAHINRQ